ncbi:MAG: pectate lyase [Bacillota bacterium]
MFRKFSISISYLLVVSMLFSMFVFTTTSAAAATTENMFEMIGFATMNGGTTGGTGGREVTATSLSQINDLMSEKRDDTSPLIIKIDGKITGTGTIAVKEVQNVTFLGVGDKGELEGIGINVQRSSNIIIRNLKIHHTKAPVDCIGIDSSKNIWVDHCELYNMIGDCNGDGVVDTKGDISGGDVDWYDGLLDVKKSSEYITISWNYFHDSFKTCLVGSSDSDNYDRKITFHHNMFKNCDERLPSYRFGTGHIFNNYSVDILGSGVNSRMGAKLRIENNVFENVGSGEVDENTGYAAGPIGAYYSDEPGFWDVKDNQFINCKGNQPTESTCSFTPPYDYSKVLHPVGQVRSIVMQNAGVGKIGDGPIITLPTTTPQTSLNYGDLNGDGNVNSTDYVILKRHVIKHTILSPEQLEAADLNLDGQVNSTDCTILKRFIIRKIDSLPYGVNTPTPTATIKPTPTATIKPTPTATIKPTPTPSPTVTVTGDPNSAVPNYMPSDPKLADLWKEYLAEEIGPMTVGTGGNGGTKTIRQTILVKSGTTYDGKGERITAEGIGDGSQSENQKPFFLLEPGANLKNVTFTAPGVEGVHMMGDNVLENVVWEDVGEDAASVRSYFPGGKITIIGGSAAHASDKMFQFNISCDVTIKNFEAWDMGKLIRQNGGTTFPMTITLENVTANGFKSAIVQSDSPSCIVYYKNLISDGDPEDWFRGSLKAIPLGDTVTPSPTPTATIKPTATVKPTPMPSSSPSNGGTQVVDSTIVVKAGQTFDGQGKRFIANKDTLGDGSQKEGQKPVFKLEKGAKLKNVILGAPAADGVHCYGDNVVENVVWEDIGEDALTVKESGTVEIIGGSAKDGEDKCFQINAACTFKVTNFTCSNVGKLIRQNGGTTFKVTIYLDNVTVNGADECVVRTDSETTELYYRNCTFTNVPKLWVFPSQSQIHPQ